MIIMSLSFLQTKIPLNFSLKYFKNPIFLVIRFLFTNTMCMQLFMRSFIFNN
jgi:hypothetical protein